MPRASSARRSGTNWDRFLHSTAMSDGRTPASLPSGHGLPSGAVPAGSASSAAAWAATQSASSVTVGSSAAHTPPRPPRSGAGSSTGTSGACARSSAWSTAAVSSTRPALRKLVESWRTVAGAPRPVGKSSREPAQVARACAAPAVDRLARVADRGDRVSAAEQGAQQHELCVAGVLVLIEQHHLVAGPLGGAHLRVALRDPRGDR